MAEAEVKERWLSAIEICKLLWVSNATVYKWIGKHVISVQRICGPDVLLEPGKKVVLNMKKPLEGVRVVIQ